jgi:N utilization substance protein B
MPDDATPRPRGARTTEEHRRTDTDSPRRSRERALKLLFQADLRGEDPMETLRRAVADPQAAAMLDDVDVSETGTAHPLDGFARRLVEGVADHRDDLDQRIQRFARRWTIARMPIVDRNVLRLATYELLHEDTPPAIVIDQAVELAKALSTDDSGRYINGVMDSVRKNIEQEPRAEAEDD